MSDKRVPCCIRGCRRSRPYRAADYVSAVEGLVWQWICGKHWAWVPRPARTLHNRIRRLEKKMSEAAGIVVRTDEGRAIWERIKREIER